MLTSEGATGKRRMKRRAIGELYTSIEKKNNK
jgi:hypothetical protein